MTADVRAYLLGLQDRRDWDEARKRRIRKAVHRAAFGLRNRHKAPATSGIASINDRMGTPSTLLTGSSPKW